MEKNCIFNQSLTELIWCAGNWSTCASEYYVMFRNCSKQCASTQNITGNHAVEGTVLKMPTITWNLTLFIFINTR